MGNKIFKHLLLFHKYLFYLIWEKFYVVNEYVIWIRVIKFCLRQWQSFSGFFKLKLIWHSIVKINLINDHHHVQTLKTSIKIWRKWTAGVLSLVQNLWQKKLKQGKIRFKMRKFWSVVIYLLKNKELLIIKYNQIFLF